MAVVDPYSPCPCGSGQKFKWCCQKVEAYADRSQRLFSNGQIDAAIEALDEGLRKEPDNPWLLVRKSIILTSQGKAEEAKPLLRRVVARQPGHIGAQSLLVRVVLETEGVAAGALQLQQALTACPPERRAGLALMPRLVGVLMSETGPYPAALKHLELARALSPGDEPDQTTDSAIHLIESNQTIAPWLKNPYELSPPPEGLAGEARKRFEQARAWADEGLWASAASAFETLSADGAAGGPADRNLGLCRLWLAETAGAVEALRRFVARAGETDEAVDLEALCQFLAPPGKDDIVERVQWIWPVRDRAGLLAALDGAADVSSAGRAPLDPRDENAPEVDAYELLDRPPLDRTSGLEPSEIPRILGRLLVGQEIVALEAFDDDRLGPLGDRFTALAGPTIAPAHPRTKVVGEVARSSLPFLWDWLMPEGVDEAEDDRLNTAERGRVLREVWPHTRLPYLGGRTPAEAARSADARVALRAAVMRMELAGSLRRDDPEFVALRESLGLPPEPEVDPESADVARLNLARLHLVPAERLGDDALIALYERARRFALPMALERAALALVDRPALFERGVERITVYSELAGAAASRGDQALARDWVRRGRDAETPEKRARDAVAWDLLEIRLKARTEAPEDWVPDLAVILDRYREDAEANQTILMTLITMGLIQMVPNPDDPQGVLLDTRPLQALLAQYGPKVTTASGRLGVSATKEGIWTPGGPSAGGGGGGGLWTPGSGSRPASDGGDRPKLIVPGR